jgi:hypothetical protein
MTADEQTISYLFKKSQGKATTTFDREFFEEKILSTQIIRPENLWFDADYIPSTAPTQLGNGEDLVVTLADNTQLPILQRHIDAPLGQIDGAPNAFFNSALKNSISHDYSDGSYHYTLKDASGAQIAYGLNNWLVDPASGVLLFFDGLPEGVQLPLTISFYTYIGRLGWSGLVNTDGSIPMQPEYVPLNPQDVMTKSYTDLGLSTLDAMLLKLLPPAPPTIDQSKPTLPYSYQAFQQGTGTQHVCCDLPQPTLLFDKAFLDGKTGTLTGYQDSYAIGSVSFTGDNVGEYNGLSVVSNIDPYAGQDGKAGFYQEITATLTPPVALTTGEHTFWGTFEVPHVSSPLQASQTAYLLNLPQPGITSSKVLDFFKDDPITPTVTLPNVTLPALTTKFISGVPTLSTTDGINLSFSVQGAVESHYGILGAKVTSSHVQNVDCPIVGTPATAAVLNYTEVLNVRPNVYTEHLQFQVVGLNSKQAFGTPQLFTLPVRVDTVSDETSRVVSGVGSFPTVFGNPFDSHQDITLLEELQLLDGIYQWPYGDYSANQPVGGPNYSTLPTSGVRWATFQPLTLLNNNGFILTVNNARNWSANAETGITLGATIYACVVDAHGQTGWIDCNSPYPGVGMPNTNGAAAMVVSQSSATVKRVTFGSTVRSGKLYIRIGLTSGNLGFGTISVVGN